MRTWAHMQLHKGVPVSPALWEEETGRLWALLAASLTPSPVKILAQRSKVESSGSEYPKSTSCHIHAHGRTHLFRRVHIHHIHIHSHTCAHVHTHTYKRCTVNWLSLCIVPILTNKLLSCTTITSTALPHLEMRLQTLFPCYQALHTPWEIIHSCQNMSSNWNKLSIWRALPTLKAVFTCLVCLLF